MTLRSACQFSQITSTAGSSCKVFGNVRGFNATVTLDQKPLDFKIPADMAAQTVLFEVEDLDVGYHSFVFNTSSVIEQGSPPMAIISRVEIDTGVTGCVLMLDRLGCNRY